MCVLVKLDGKRTLGLPGRRNLELSPSRSGSKALGIRGILRGGAVSAAASHRTFVLGELSEGLGVQHGAGESCHGGIPPSAPVCPAELLDGSLSQGGCSHGSGGKGN